MQKTSDILAVDLGFDKVCFHAGPDLYAFIDGYGKEVLPHIRERNGQVVKVGA